MVEIKQYFYQDNPALDILGGIQGRSTRQKNRIANFRRFFRPPGRLLTKRQAATAEMERGILALQFIHEFALLIYCLQKGQLEFCELAWCNRC